MRVIEVSAPSNIALIKYMGKTDVSTNKPTNASLSYTLPHLQSYVRLTEDPTLKADQWSPLIREGLDSISLSEKGQARFLQHFANLKQKFQIEGFYRIESANDFPSDCGLASSASSFAALTKAAVLAFMDINSEIEKLSIYEQAELSRRGSGSSCRSFFTPWSVWDEEGAREVQGLPQAFLHAVVIVGAEKKAVSSSDAHKRVITSDLFVGRVRRVELRLKDLLSALSSQDWQNAFELCWAEFWDMHALFLTSKPSFSYLLPGSVAVTHWLHQEWQSHKQGPLVTMDAGANVHLLYPMEFSKLAHEQLMKIEAMGFKVISQNNFSA